MGWLFPSLHGYERSWVWGLAAIVIAAVIELVDIPALINLYRAYTSRLGREFGFVASLGREPGPHGRYSDAETIPFIDVTAARMLGALNQDLRRRGVRLLIARDVGQVRDVLRNVIDDPALTHVYPSVQTAVHEATRRVVGASG